MIKNIGQVNIPESVILNADKIKFEHYKVNSPSKFQVHTLDDKILINDLSKLIDIPIEKLDYVYFSVCKGAEPHIDLLDPKKFTNITYVIPIILPKGISTITAENNTIIVNLGNVYQFDHTNIHSMELEDTESGCVL